MDKHVIFLSDAHLSIGYPQRMAKMLDFMLSPEFRSASAVYILGDLFDFWIGPKHIELTDYQDIISSLKRRTQNGQQINFIYGNRDFLVDKSFAKATGVKILGDSADLQLDDKKVWLTHGDLLCTLDKGYRSYRRLARSELIKSAYKSIPQKASYGIGKSLRGLSTHLVKQKPDPERNITPKAVEATFKKGYDIIICGHVHRNGVENHPNGKTLYTLGSFGEGGHYLIYQNGSFTPSVF
jgi:UDP-2,3-diacylglucosamine hydrolase